MDTAALWTQIGIGLVAIAALVVSVLAYRRSGLRDRRAHEHRDVQWNGSWVRETEETVGFVLTNVGTTDARKVRAQVRDQASGKMVAKLNLGTFKPGKSLVIHEVPAESHDSIELLFSGGQDFTVNWLSPLGHPEDYKSFVPQVF